MTCAVNEHIAICRPTLDAWSRFFTKCPVCKVRRLCLEEFQDWYGSRCVCLTCGTRWMEGEYIRPGKREARETVARAKARIKEYIAAGIPQGYERYMQRLKAELAAKSPEPEST